MGPLRPLRSTLWLLTFGVLALTLASTYPMTDQPLTWNEFIVAARERTFLGAILTAGVGAWWGRHLAAGHLLAGAPAARPASWRAAGVAAPLLTAAVLGWAAGLTPRAVLTLASTSSEMWTMGIALVPILLAWPIWVLVGLLTGSAWPSRWATLLSAGIAVILLFVPSLLTVHSDTSRFSALAPAPRWGNSFPPLGFAPEPWLITAQSVLFVAVTWGLASVVNAVVEGVPPLTIMRRAVVTCAPAVAGIAALLHLQPVLVHPAQAPTVCQREAGLTVCTRASTAALLPELEKAIAPVLEVLPQPGSLTVLGPGASGFESESGTDEYALSVYQFPSMDRYRDEVTNEVVHELTGRTRCEEHMPRTGGFPPHLVERLEVQRSLAESVLARLDDQPDSTPFATLTSDELADLYTENQSSIRRCLTTLTELLP